ncbi:MAG: sigma-54-dependent transcriptional regulator [Planctomycetota bacterium]
MDILLVEDERSLAIPLGDSLQDAGYRVTVLFDGAAALAWLARKHCDLVVTDVRLPGSDGIHILEKARLLDPPADVIVMTGYATVEQAVTAMRIGASGYLQKPFEVDELLGQIERLAESRRMREELQRLRGGGGLGEDLGLAGVSRVLEEVRNRIRAAAASPATLLITGESGTGKERVARALHEFSPRSGKPFEALSCAAIPESLMEGELFGFQRGAFTGAVEDRIGRLELAGAGTLFLDDVDDLPARVQVGLLRALQEREFMPLGASRTRKWHARLVAATKADLVERVRAGSFREDLYYRLAVVPLPLPPLRERREDIPALVAAFLERLDPEGKLEVRADTLGRLRAHDWPGNVRELENAVVRAVALRGRATILRYEHFLPGGPVHASTLRAEDVPSLRESIRRAEREAIRAALSLTEGRRAEAARLLGISRKALWQKAKELGLEDS